MAAVFHIPTLTVCLAATLIILAGFLTLLWATERDNRALGLWSLGFSAGALGMVLVSLRDVAPPLLALGVGNALGIYSLGLIWMGCQAFEEEPRKGAGLVAAAGAVVWLSLFALPGFSTDLGMRLLVASVLYAFYSFLIIPVLLRGQRREPLPARMLAILAFGTHGAAYLVRLPLLVVEPVQLVAGHAPLWYGIMTFGFFVQGLLAALAVLGMVHERATQRYKIASETDGLTRLKNRRAFIDSIATLRASRDGSAGGAVMALVDVDHFKEINDTHGHGAGDLVLMELGRLLSRAMPQGSIVGRLGGEEFGIYLSAEHIGQRVDLLEDLRLSVAEMIVGDGHSLPKVTVSIGAVLLPSGPLDFPQALALADKALYASKKAGRNSVTWSGQEAGRLLERSSKAVTPAPEFADPASRSAA